MLPDVRAPASSAVLLSGGVDSAVLLADEATRGVVQPIYVSVGLAWEADERTIVDAFLNALAASSAGRYIRPLAALRVAMDDLYPAGHWAITGRAPGYSTPDNDVYLPGRNIALLSKAGIYCAAAGVERLALGTLAGNPFPDATAEFLTAMGRALSLGLAHPLSIEAPYAAESKRAVLQRGRELAVPFALTLSCMQPARVAGDALPQHCGGCSKCRERHDAFVDAGIDDPTAYADRRFVDQGRSRNPSARDQTSRPAT